MAVGREQSRRPNLSSETPSLGRSDQTLSSHFAPGHSQTFSRIRECSLVRRCRPSTATEIKATVVGAIRERGHSFAGATLRTFSHIRRCLLTGRRSLLQRQRSEWSWSAR